MHIALIADEERLAFEHTMLNRLSVGLIDDGAQLTRLIPDNLAGEAAEHEERQIALANRIRVPMRVYPWMHRARTEQLADALQRSMPDVLYAAGDRAWRVALELGPEIERPVVLDVWSLAQMQRVPVGRNAAMVRGYVVPTEPMAAALSRRVDRAAIHVVPFGVSVPSQPRQVLVDIANAIALVVIGSCEDLSAYRAVLGALAQIAHQFPQAHMFIELRGRFQHAVWQVAGRLNLLKGLTALTNAVQMRPLLTRCDALILPERLGELRSLTLEAMAAGMPVLAADDPMNDMLKDGRTALIVPEASVEAWVGPMRHILSQPDRAREMGLAGRTWVSTRHRSSEQAKALLGAMERILHTASCTESHPVA